MGFRYNTPELPRDGVSAVADQMGWIYGLVVQSVRIFGSCSSVSGMRRSNLDGRREAFASSRGGAEAYALGYVESLNDARTLLMDYLQHPVRGESRRGGDEGRVSSGYA